MIETNSSNSSFYCHCAFTETYKKHNGPQVRPHEYGINAISYLQMFKKKKNV